MKVVGNVAINNFLRAPNVNTRGALIYGVNYGLVSAFIDKIKSSLGMDSYILDFRNVKKNVEILISAMFERSLLYDKTLIVVRNISGNESLPKELQSALTAYNGQNYPIFAGDALEAKSTLRAFFEQSPKYAAIACYDDNESAILAVIRQWMEKNNVTGDPNCIANKFRGCDRLFIASELDKFRLLFDGDSISIEMISDVVDFEVTEKDGVNDLCFAVLEGRAFEKEFYNAMSLNECGFIARAMSGYLYRLLTAKEHIKAGADKRKAMAQVTPPVLFKFQAKFLEHVDTIPEKLLTDLLSALVKFEAYRTDNVVYARILFNILALKGEKINNI